ncbi:MFS transporter [Nioella nitratireducens]|uniref:MFS transporter n=1 Tax=Nioella nitratireducens TaxID=1287720 RepID=UPI0008FD4BBA|nr:MFS transporter [Nioella nitratireducens]
MLPRHIPEWLRHAPAPGVKGFAVLAGCEAAARGSLVSVLPLAVFQHLGDASRVSGVYFAVGVLSLLAGLSVPWLNRFIPRKWLYSGAAMLFLSGALLGAVAPSLIVVTLAMITVATVALFVCFNAYVLDYIQRVELGRCETLRMFYSAAGWTLGPVAGVYLMGWWRPAPFLISAMAVAGMLATFLYLRLGNGKLIQRARGPATNPLAFLGRFAAQPRLVAGWLFAVIRSCGWWVYVVYLPIFAVNAGLGQELGGTILSVSNALLFTTPVMLRWMQTRSVRVSVRTGFMGAALLALGAWALAGWPVAVVGLLAAGSFFLVWLDVCGGLPFLMAVRPSERTEMSAVYSSFRDVSGILTPGAAWLVLLVAPLSAIFALSGLSLLAAWTVAGKLHPRLGLRRIRVPVPEPAPDYGTLALPVKTGGDPA